VAQGLPPFDRPTLRSELAPAGANHFGAATPGSGGIEPLILADSPPVLGNALFQIGLATHRRARRPSCSWRRGPPARA
jgi:hypothetical protein